MPKAVALPAIQEVTATQAKNSFGTVLEDALRGRHVVVTKRGEPAAVVLSIEEYEALKGTASPSLEALDAQFDALYMSMQSPSSKAGVNALFDSTPEQLGRSALKAAGSLE